MDTQMRLSHNISRPPLSLASGFLLGLLLTAGAVGAQIGMTVSGIRSEGVRLIPPSSPEVSAALEAGREPAFDVLLPYSALLTNDSDKTIIAYALRWSRTDQFGRVNVSRVTTFDFSKLPIRERSARRLGKTCVGPPGLRYASGNAQ